VVEAIERHFDEVRDNMSGRWPDDDRPAVADLPHTKRNR
jgi:hypothetical protein